MSHDQLPRSFPRLLPLEISSCLFTRKPDDPNFGAALPIPQTAPIEKRDLIFEILASSLSAVGLIICRCASGLLFSPITSYVSRVPPFLPCFLRTRIRGDPPLPFFANVLPLRCPTFWTAQFGSNHPFFMRGRLLGSTIEEGAALPYS